MTEEADTHRSASFATDLGCLWGLLPSDEQTSHNPLISLGVVALLMMALNVGNLLLASLRGHIGSYTLFHLEW